jgi:hypothetical protein
MWTRLFFGHWAGRFALVRMYFVLLRQRAGESIRAAIRVSPRKRQLLSQGISAYSEFGRNIDVAKSRKFATNRLCALLCPGTNSATSTQQNGHRSATWKKILGRVDASSLSTIAHFWIDEALPSTTGSEVTRL